MPFAVSRTDTGQFVIQDPRTDSVVIDDDLAAGFAKLEAAVADAPAKPGMTALPSAPGQGGSAFAFSGGPRYAVITLAVVLPFLWLAVLYFALANLLSEAALGRGEQRELRERVEQLEGDLEAMRAESVSAPRMSKSKPKPKTKPDASKPKPDLRESAPTKTDAKAGEDAPSAATKAGGSKD